MFLLDVKPRVSGGTLLVFDAGVTDRVQMLVPDTAVHQTLLLSPEDHIGQSLSDVRPPARTRRPQG
jgi:hypothetical protein